MIVKSKNQCRVTKDHTHLFKKYEHKLTIWSKSQTNTATRDRIIATRQDRPIFDAQVLNKQQRDDIAKHVRSIYPTSFVSFTLATKKPYLTEGD